MKIFISWSGERSRLAAELLNNWLQCVLQAVDPWLSSKDIDRGSLWFTEITTQLSTTHNGIVCLTKSNLDKPWILFESGALAKGLTSNRVYTFLVDLNPEEVRDPLAQFNHTKPQKESLYQLVRSINNGLESNSLKENILSNVFETYWPQFEKDFKEILKKTPDEEIVEKRPKDDLLNEILYSVRGIDKRLRIIEDSEINYNKIKNSYYHNNKIDFKQTPIEMFNLSEVTRKQLRDLDINNYDDLLNLKLTTLEKFDNKTNKEIREMVDNAAKNINFA